MLEVPVIVRMGGIAAGLAAPLAVLLSLGCDTTRLAANSTAGVFERAAPAVEGYWDYRTAGDAMPANLMQLEGLARVVPENDAILMQLIKVYVAYAYGWIEDRAEDLQLAGDLEAAELERVRARQMYLRARDVGKHAISLDHDGLESALSEGLEGFEAYLDREFEDSDEAPILFWTGYAWGSFINLSLNDISAVSDLGYAKALVARSVELDPTYFNSAGLTFLGVASSVELSGDLDAARALFERALTQTERHSLIVQVNMARFYAVRTQDRELYVTLLQEVLDAGNVNPQARLNNEIAKRRAKRYLEEVDERF
jgi:hypothetical protein